MKVCPSCQSRFVGGETFCPHDGTKLVDARELSPGELTGSDLGGVVHLDRLMYADALGERYAGRLIESRRRVFVTVFNQHLEVSEEAQRRVETLRARVGASLPDAVNTVLSLHLTDDPPYLIESEPRGPSLRSLLDENVQVDWQDAVKVAANLARVAQWLVDQGAPAPLFHPCGIYVARLSEGALQISDWYLEALLERDSPQRALEANGDAFVGYVDYMPPELSEDTSGLDIRSTMYSLGCLVYEMILGKPPLPARSPIEALKRHRHEKPVRLGIARGKGEFPTELDDIVEMLLAKEPNSRFQSANAVCAALANLVDASPEALAPTVERSEEVDEDDLYRTIDMASVDREALMGASTEDSAASEDAADDASGRAVSGESSTRDEDEAEREEADAPEPGDDRRDAATGQFGKPAATIDGDASRKTLLFGSISAVASEESEADEATSSPTLMMGSVPSVEYAEPVEAEDEAASAHPTLLAFDNSRKSEGDAAGEEPRFGIVKSKKAGRSAPNGTTGDDPDSVQALSRADISAELESAAPASDAPDEQVPTKKLTPLARPGDDIAEPSSDDEDAADEADEPDESGTDEDVDGADEAASGESTDAAEERPAVNIGDIGSVPARDHTLELDKSWFNQSTEDAWDASLVREEHQRAERSNRTIIIGIVVALAILAAGVYVYSEFLYEPEEAADEEAVAEAEETAPEIDLAAIASSFDRALTDGRLIAPMSNSALHYLRQLQRHGRDSGEYENARQRFVESARAAAQKAEATDLGRARDLAGYASQFAPEDEALAEYSRELQRRWKGGETAIAAGGAADAGQLDAGAPDAAPAPDAEPPETASEPTETREPAVAAKKPREPKARKPRQRAKKPASSGESAAELAREARVAFSRGDMSAATELYHDALRVDPKSGEVYAGLGKVYFERANYREAVKYQQKAVRYAPGRMDYRVSLGQSFYRLGKYEQAIKVWEGVLQKDPENRFARQYIELARKKL